MLTGIAASCILKKNLMDEIKEMSLPRFFNFFFLFLFLNQNIRDLCLRYSESRINEEKRKDIYGLFSLLAPTKSKRCPFILSQFFFFLNRNNIRSCLILSLSPSNRTQTRRKREKYQQEVFIAYSHPQNQRYILFFSF